MSHYGSAVMQTPHHNVAMKCIFYHHLLKLLSSLWADVNDGNRNYGGKIDVFHVKNYSIF